MTGRSHGSGVLVVDKGAGLTSFQVVAHLRRLLRPGKIGHAGTLDPEATGVLPILIGEATKLAPYLLEHDKEYVATVRLGVTTDTHDLTGRVSATADVPPFTPGELALACRSLVGTIEQVPPMYSALHHRGRRLYELARTGIEVERPPRQVVVRSIALEAVALPALTLRIVCGRGTYVRALAADLGRRLGVGAAVASLRRTRVGPFALADAVPWPRPGDSTPDMLWERLLPPDRALPGYPEVVLDGAATTAFLHGQSVGARAPDAGRVRVYGADRRFIAVGRALPGGRVKPERILHADPPRPRVLPA